MHDRRALCGTPPEFRQCTAAMPRRRKTQNADGAPQAYLEGDADRPSVGQDVPTTLGTPVLYTVQEYSGRCYRGIP